MADFTTIKNLCSERNLSLSELAVNIGITYTGLNKIITTNRTTVDTLEKIAKALNINVGYFFNERNSSITQNGAINMNGSNSISIGDARHEIELLKKELEGKEKEIAQIQYRIKEKDDMIEFLKQQLAVEKKI